MRPSLLAGLAVLAATSGCSLFHQATTSAPSASAEIRDASGRSLGTLVVREDRNGLSTTGTLRGLTPGLHGIHIHTVGRCEPPFTSAGGHWNPMARTHGFDNPSGPHMGDMRNIEVGNDGVVDVSVHTQGGTLTGTRGLLDADGASIVIHASADDYRTDPAGNSGARIACGVVTLNP